MRARRATILVLPVIAAGILLTEGALTARRGPAGEDYLATLTPGEVTGTILLGGLRSVAVNVLWLRARNLLEENRHLEVPAVFEAITNIQGRYPYVWRLLSENLAFDIPAVVKNLEARRRWIIRGLREAEEGFRRTDATMLLEYQCTLYAWRFHPEMFPEDYRWFLADEKVNPRRRDPLAISREKGEAAVSRDDHGPFADLALLASYRLAERVAVSRGDAGTARAMVEKVRRLTEHVERAHPLRYAAWVRLIEAGRRSGDRP